MCQRFTCQQCRMHAPKGCTARSRPRVARLGRGEDKRRHAWRSESLVGLESIPRDESSLRFRERGFNPARAGRGISPDFPSRASRSAERAHARLFHSKSVGYNAHRSLRSPARLLHSSTFFSALTPTRHSPHSEYTFALSNANDPSVKMRQRHAPSSLPQPQRDST